jgi:hypothetical protein
VCVCVCFVSFRLIQHTIFSLNSVNLIVVCKRSELCFLCDVEVDLSSIILVNRMLRMVK